MSYSESYRRLLNRMGYYDYQSGLIFRHLNQESGWDSHLEKCRSYIIRALELYKPEKVTVLGSGWLLDLPIAEIVERTGKVSLVDIIHPPDVVKQAGDIPNVELIESDVTGGLIKQVGGKIKNNTFFKKANNLKGIIIPDYIPGDDPGMIISLNLITQLEVLPLRYIRKKALISEDELLQFRKAIQESHIRFLSRYRSVLITDFEEIITDKSGAIKNIPTLIAELPEASAREEWTWNFDLKGADYYNSRSVMNVIAITL